MDDDTRLEDGHAPPPKVRRVTSFGDPSLEVGWEDPTGHGDLDDAAFRADPGLGVDGPMTIGPRSGLLQPASDKLRRRPVMGLVAAGLLAIACVALRNPLRQVFHRRTDRWQVRF
ncbi:MAG: hypothetical protein V4759_05650 [Pseudomonadota bacterium]